MWLRSQRPLESSIQHVSQCPKPVDVTLYSKRDLAHVIKLRVLYLNRSQISGGEDRGSRLVPPGGGLGNSSLQILLKSAEAS